MQWPSPFADDQLWDLLLLGGDSWPGLPTVETTKSRAVDTPKTKGSDGANLVDNGYEPAKVKITVRIWTTEQWLELNKLIPKIDPQAKGGIRSPVDIIHPEPNSKGVFQLYIQQINPITVDKGVATFSVDALEWWPAPKPVKTSKKSKTGGDIPTAADVTPPSANRSAQQNIL